MSDSAGIVLLVVGIVFSFPELFRPEVTFIGACIARCALFATPTKAFASR